MSDFRVDYDACLVEEAVLRALPGHPEEGEFRQVRDQLYELGDPDERDQAFRTFHGQWFQRLGLCQPLADALGERPILRQQTRRCAVVRARSKKEEGAELFVSSEGRSIGVQLRPESLLDSGQLLGLLRHEFLHVADMLDPDFGYEPELHVPEEGMARRLVQDRYRVLWDALIDGRLTREGRAPAGVRVRRFQDFARAFPMLGPDLERYFARYFDQSGHCHADLVSCARDPVQALGLKEVTDRRCSLCNFPSCDFEPRPEDLPASLVARVMAHFPTWHPSQGLCRQCADLYRGRALLAERA
ncbi:MAG: hypothetical protein HYW07_12705 [Candidatus Latescibacteria bacterium]|nr:hypothetical protein [Candidatus Latescibacterota bacterium]